ncbi:hypothetical protein STFE110948_01510 [Streptobacillus felis]|uniref:DUF2127 domain-containing protein n=1 Tax=Streptobacillus felis TaxID=1384509 RepID=A0A7Z0PEL3_9FUSO|nr:hypothetical protein [Streptobacillus felis]NYV27599.1 hypothetical protein [Streptobacillus felis]
MKLDKVTLNKYLLMVLFIMIFESLSSMYAVKSIDIFNKVHIETGISLNDYITIEMIKYFSSVSIFIIFSIYTYITYKHYKINSLYKGVWTLFIIANILFKIFVFKQDTIFYYLSIIVQFILVVYIIKFKEKEREE